MHAKRVLLVLAAATAAALYVGLDLGRFLTLDALKENRAALLAFKAEHEAAFAAGFVAVYVLQSALSLPGAALLSLAAGALFGVAAGAVYAVSAATAGATLACLAARTLFRDAVAARLGARMAGIDRELEARGLNYLLFLRLVPVFPFFLVNLAAGLTRLPMRTFVAGTFLGIIPGGLVYVNAGAGLAAVESLRGIASPRVLGSFALLGLFALLPALYGRFRGKAGEDRG